MAILPENVVIDQLRRVVEGLGWTVERIETAGEEIRVTVQRRKPTAAQTVVATPRGAP